MQEYSMLSLSLTVAKCWETFAYGRGRSMDAFIAMELIFSMAYGQEFLPVANLDGGLFI